MESISTSEIALHTIIGVLGMLLLIVTIVFISQRISFKRQLRIQLLKNKHQKKICKSIISTQEKERQEIAKNIHDNVGTSLSAINLLLSLINSKSKGEIKKMLGKVQDYLHPTVSMSRKAISDLYPASLIRFGFFDELNSISRQIQRSNNIKFHVGIYMRTGRLKAATELTLYRVIMEFVNNTLRFANATTIDIIVELNYKTLHINIKDDGGGFDVAKGLTVGNGLNNMESRISLLDGKSRLISTVGVGTTLDIEIPLTKKDIAKLNTDEL